VRPVRYTGGAGGFRLFGIRFGTDGWRAVLADGFTLGAVRRVAAAAGRVWRRAAGEGATILVGHDTRFLGARFAEAAASALAGQGLQARVCPHPLPTPALSFAVSRMGAAGAVMVTASHNPPEWSGLKLKGPHGGPVDASFTRAVEDALTDAEPAAGPAAAPFDPLPAYCARLRELVDVDAIAAMAPRVICDPMHGSGAGVLAGLLRGAGIDAREIRSAPDPTFGGLPPEPIAPNLAPLQAAVRASVLPAVGLATDGDADRVGAVDETGGIVDAQRIFALLLRHLARDRGLRGVVAKTYAVTDMVDRLARDMGLPLRVLPVGFKHVTAVALREPLLIGGEEAGGIGVGMHLPERDGILAGLLLLSAMAAAGRPLRELVADLLAELGPHVYGRVDLRLGEADRQAAMAALREPPATLAGLPVTAVERLDGVKVRLGEHGWLLWRLSGTEPLLRVYAETDREDRLDGLLRAGVAACRAGVA
jgi:phosphomannomutase